MLRELSERDRASWGVPVRECEKGHTLQTLVGWLWGGQSSLCIVRDTSFTGFLNESYLHGGQPRTRLKLSLVKKQQSFMLVGRGEEGAGYFVVCTMTLFLSMLRENNDAVSLHHGPRMSLSDVTFCETECADRRAAWPRSELQAASDDI